MTAARQRRPSDTQIAAVGLAGEVAALEWLKARFPGFSEMRGWLSGYRNQILGDGAGNDHLGYDLQVEDRRRRRLFEVKATVGEEPEFMLTGAEIARALNLRSRETYNILFVTHVLQSDRRRLYLLPNPLDPAGRTLFQSVDEGVRYEFRPRP